MIVSGQVEDDRAVTSSGTLSSKLELLRSARAEPGPIVHLIHKPHPDGPTGFADHIETKSPVPTLIAMVKERHVNSLVAGFRGCHLSCPAEVKMERLCEGANLPSPAASAVVAARRAVGWINKLLRT